MDVFSIIDPESNDSLGHFVRREDAEHWVRESVAVVDEQQAARVEIVAGTLDAGQEWIVISLRIENSYELYAPVTMELRSAVILAPPPETTEAYEDWVMEEIMSWTGAGHPDGDSWYDVTVLHCSDPALTFREFDWGY